MLQFIADNIATILVGLAVLAILIASLWVMYRDKRKAAKAGGCGCGCCSCPYAGGCGHKG